MDNIGDGLQITPKPGVTRVEMIVGGDAVSGLSIIPYVLQIGAARVRMDGIAAVETDEPYRMQGHARRVLNAAIEQMRSGDAALSMLYGIRDIYPKFGYTTAGPDHFLVLRDPHNADPLPHGWQARPIRKADLPTVHRIYDQATAGSVGTAIRTPDRRSVQRLSEAAAEGSSDPCLLLIDPTGAAQGYVWRAGWNWYVRQVQREQPGVCVIGEALALTRGAADAALTVCRRLAQAADKAESPVREIIVGTAPGGLIMTAAMYQDAHRLDYYTRCGSSMARVLDVTRLFSALAPELSARLIAAGKRFHPDVVLETEIGATLITVRDGVVTVREATIGEPSPIRWYLPQHELARLALGAFPPEDIVERMPEETRDLGGFLVTMFPQRQPHMHLPDRF